MSKLKKRIAEENDSLWEINFHEGEEDKLVSENGDYYYGKVYQDKYHLKMNNCIGFFDIVFLDHSD